MAIETKGFLSEADVAKLPGVPSRNRMERGACAVIECAQAIPCNPCETACPEQAISIGTPLTRLPVLDEDACTGCGLCVAICPGLAIFNIELNYDDQNSRISLPYEFYPLPAAGDSIRVLDRKGEEICSSRILKVRNPKKFDHTAVVSFPVPKHLAMAARNIRPEGKYEDE